MPVTSDLGGKNYVLGRGRVTVGRFTAAQLAAGITAATFPSAERYIGNTPSFSTTGEGETLDHFDSDAGINTKDDSVDLSFNRSGSFSCDNINAANLALLFLSDGVTSVTQSAGTAVVYNVLAAQRGTFVQVGRTASLPTGVRNISNVSVTKGPSFSTNVTAAGNYEVDEALGRIYILPGSADIPDNTDIRITYDAAAGTREQVISKSTSIYASLHFVANNPKGVNRDYYFPYVKLTPNGDYNLKGDDWQTMTFNFEILKKGSLEAVYVDGRPA